jgi:ATP-dependent Lon protease
LGPTIKESCEIAYTHAKKLLSEKLSNHFLEETKLHMHFPAGAVKKDGPSAGIAIASALISMALGKPLKERTAMTGEISLTGKVLRIGGLKEKVLAAKREGIEHIIVPEGNRGDYEELPESLKAGVQFYFAEEYKQVMKVAFDMDI